MANESKEMMVVAVTGNSGYSALSLISSLLHQQGKSCAACNDCQSIKAVKEAMSWNTRFPPQILLVTTNSKAVVKYAKASFDSTDIDPRNVGIVLQQWVNDFVDGLNREAE